MVTTPRIPRRPICAEEAEVIAAGKTAPADHFVRTLPDGYKTVINEGSSKISPGQMQLLTIARAILADPGSLFLDEATSSVAAHTEVLIQKAMDYFNAGPHQLYHCPSPVHQPRRQLDPGEE